MTEERWRSGSQQRILRAIEVLADRPFVAVRPSELAARLGCSADQASRTLRNLEDAGWARASPDGFRIGARATRLSEGVRAAFAAELRAYLGEGAA